MELSTETVKELGRAHTELNTETLETEMPARWETPAYALLTKLDAFLAEYFVQKGIVT